jgi:hypothetical protein
VAGRLGGAMKHASRGASSCTPPALDRHLETMASMPYPGLLLLRHVGRAWAEAEQKHLGRDGEPDHLGGILMKMALVGEAGEPGRLCLP